MYYRYLMCVTNLSYIVYEDCDVNLCQNGATCQKIGDNYLCLCPLGFNGSLCSEGRGHSCVTSQYFYDNRAHFLVQNDKDSNL